MQCVAQLYHCWQPTVYVERVRERVGGYHSQGSLGWPPTHSTLLCVLLLRQSHPSHLPVHRNTLLVGGEMYISGSALCKHSGGGGHSTLKHFSIYDKSKKKHTTHTALIWDTDDKRRVIVPTFFQPKRWIFNNDILKNPGNRLSSCMCAVSRTRTTATLGIIYYSYLLKPQPCFILLSHFPQTNLRKCELTRQMERFLNLLHITHVAVWFSASGVCKTRGLSKNKKIKKRWTFCLLQSNKASPFLFYW